MHYELRVVGNPIAHSKSPVIHQEFARQTRLSFNYERVLAPLDDFAATIYALQKAGVHGLNVTLPFKEQAFALSQERSGRAERAQAANTFLFKAQGRIFADNTDGIGLVHDIQHNCAYSLRDKRVLICGAGGAVRGILFPLIQTLPGRLAIANRTLEKALKLSGEFSNAMPIQALSYPDLALQEFDVIIDGTAFADEALPLPSSLHLSQNSLCYDLKYQVGDSSFMRWAKARHAGPVYDGLGMLVEQAAIAFELWTGRMPATRRVIELLRSQLSR